MIYQDYTLGIVNYGFQKICLSFRLGRVRLPDQSKKDNTIFYINAFCVVLSFYILNIRIIHFYICISANLLTKSYRRGRVQNILKVDFRSKLMDIKMKNKFDNRNGKTFATDTDLTYVIRKFARDNIKLVTKIINQSSKSLTKARVSM